MSHPPLVAVDIGNSSTKVGLFTETSYADPATLPQPAWSHSVNAGDQFDELRNLLPSHARWLVASVQRETERRLSSWVAAHHRGDSYRLLTYRDLPLACRVDQPEQVGMDRLAGAVAANALRDSHRAAIIVSAGSAVTVNLLSPDGEFEGGAILPGFRMSARALSAADLLPEIILQSANDAPPVLGTNTAAAIRSGLYWGTVGAVREIIERFSERYRRPQVFVTGGDLQRLAPLMSADARFVSNLALAGIAIAARSLPD